MKILAIETATDACSAAVLIDEEIHTEFALAPRQHTQLILKQIEAVLAVADIRLNQLDALAFGRGPGAFTGLRIAAGVTQGLALAVDLPAIGISTLAAMAQSAYHTHRVEKAYVGLDARMQQVYWGEYHIVEGYSVLQGEEQVIAPDALAEKHAEGFVGIGSAWQVYQTPLQQRITANHSDFFQNIYPSAASIAYLAVPQYKNNQYIYAETGEIQPVYLRNKVAQTLIERSKA